MVWNSQFVRGMWEHFTVKRARAGAVLADAEKEKLDGIQGEWQMESPFKIVLEQIKTDSDMSCNACVMLRACYAERTGSWEGFKEAFRDRRNHGTGVGWRRSLRQGCFGRRRPPEHCTRHFAKKHRLVETSHSACFWSGVCDHTSAHIVTVFLWRITYGGCHWGTATATTKRRSSVVGGVQLWAASALGELSIEYW